MKALARFVLCAALLATAMAARAERTFSQPELDALLAPVALYPDPVLANILVAASHPEDVQEAAAWSRANPQLRGDEATRLAQNLPWHESVKALLATPEVLVRMDENPAWMNDLGEASRAHGPYLMDTVQGLRQRAQANGYPPSYYAPAPSGVVYLRYYDPYVVYGSWWWPVYRPIVWRPFVTRVVVVSRPVYVQRPVPVQRPVVVQRPPIVRAQFGQSREPPRNNGAPSPARQGQIQYERERERARAPQQGSQRQERDHTRRRDSRPPRHAAPKDEARGKFGH